MAAASNNHAQPHCMCKQQQQQQQEHPHVLLVPSHCAQHTLTAKPTTQTHTALAHLTVHPGS
jgi:hypothetical protein